jgi:signal transduction histidine kinase
MIAKLDLQTILIVDDNATNLEVLSDTLIDSGFQVAVAVDGESALEQLEYHQPELILLDVMMPGIDGYETCRRLKQNPLTSDIPVIFMTALSETKNKVKGLSLGAVDYITKPFQRQEVLARVRAQLQLRDAAKKLETQNELLKQEIERREQAEAALLELNQRLEQQVEERTQQLLTALQELQQIQLQLIHSERMSSLGQLVAGVAHEINNPINFIYGNLAPAAEYTQALLHLVNLYQLYSPPASEIQEQIEIIDLEFLKQDLPKLLGSMKLGAERIRQIVTSLRCFSRLDEAEMKLVDIHEGIDSTLLILQNRLKSRTKLPAIEIVKRYSKLPLIECYAGQLNQVFMNIIANAIDVLEEQNLSRTSVENNAASRVICISTNQIHQDWVSIRIKDNGPGISEEVRSKLFLPFFTTKPTGKGTGLGLSISYQIVVEKHKGRLECCSLPGQGTEFIIEIPIRSSLVNAV